MLSAKTNSATIPMPFRAFLLYDERHGNQPPHWWHSHKTLFPASKGSARGILIPVSRLFTSSNASLTVLVRWRRIVPQTLQLHRKVT